MNVSKIELYGTTGTVIRYVEEGNKIVFDALDAEVTGTVTNVAFDGNRIPADQAVRVSGFVKEGKVVTYNRLQYPIKLGFYGMRPR